MGRFTRPLAAVVLGGALIVAAGPAAFAQSANAGRDGVSDERAVAVGTDDAITFDMDSANQAPDNPTTISVGGDSNLGVPAPDLGRVPSSGDGQFGGRFASLLNPPAESEPAPAETTATEETSAPVDAVPAETAEGEPVEAVPVDLVPEDQADAIQVAPPTTTDAPDPIEEAPALPTCADYGSWYDAQLALEADAGLAPSLDPDGNGIACEDGMY